MDWTKLDWVALDRLRDGFLHGSAASGPYWQSESALASYDLTYGERIGWKWDQVLRELSQRGWVPRAGTSVFDWGCGSGVAARRVLAHFGDLHFDALRLWDHAPLAIDFAEQRARQAFPALRIEGVTPGFLQGTEPVGLLLLSHVLNEVSAEQLTALRHIIKRAETVIWVEPGTSEVSRGLGTIRDTLLGDFSVVAPCTHQNACPMFQDVNERHWCHFFAPPPPEIFGSSDWVKFGQRAGIDLRSLPYCFLALDRRPSAAPSGCARVIGRPEHFKPYARLLSCDAEGLTELTLPKRANPTLFKELERTKQPLVYRWEKSDHTIVNGTAVDPIGDS